MPDIHSKINSTMQTVETAIVRMILYDARPDEVTIS